MASAKTGTRLVILDRDGVINRDSTEFVKSPDEWIPLAGSLDAIATLHRAGYTVAIATNQSGIARGYFDWATLDAMHDKLHALVGDAGGRVDRIEVCPHGPDDESDCRKPKPGMLNRLVAHYGVEPASVIAVGDSRRDLEAAVAAGVTPVLVRTGNGRDTEAGLDAALGNVEVFDDLAAVAASLTGTEPPTC